MRRLVSAGLIGVIGVLGLVPAGAATRADDSRPDPIISLIGQDFVIDPGGVWRARYEIIGDAGAEILIRLQEGLQVLVNQPGEGDLIEIIDPLADFEIVITSYVPITDRADIPGVLAGITGNALDGARLGLSPFLRAGEQGSAIIDLEVTTALDGDRLTELEFPVAGLYPVTMDLRFRDTLVARHLTIVERLETDDDPTPRLEPYLLAVVATVDDPGEQPTDLDLIAVRSGLLEIAEIAEATSVPLTLGLPPAVADVLDSDPELRARLVAALRGEEIISVPAVDIDPSAAVEAGEIDAFTRQLRTGENELARRLPGVATRRGVSLQRRPVSRAGAAMLRDLGTQTILVEPELHAEWRGSSPSGATSFLDQVVLPDNSTMSIVTVDPVSRLLMADEAGIRTPAERAVVLLAELTADRRSPDDRPRVAVLSTDDLGRPDADVLVELESMVAAHPHIAFDLLTVAATGATDTPTAPITLPERAGDPLIERSEVIGSARLRAATIGSMLPATDDRPAAWEDSLDRLLSTGVTNDEARRAVEQFIDEIDAIPAAISFADPFTFTLTGRSSDIELRITNTSDTALAARLLPRSAKLGFPLGVMDLVLEPGVNVVDVPVQTRSNGTFPVTFFLRTPTGDVPIGQPLELTARVNAVTGLGQLITVGAMLVLASWWFSHLRSRRRAQRANDDSAPTEDEAATTVTDA